MTFECSFSPTCGQMGPTPSYTSYGAGGVMGYRRRKYLDQKLGVEEITKYSNNEEEIRVF